MNNCYHLFSRNLFWTEYHNCRIRRCSFSSGKVTEILPSNHAVCPFGVATDASERRIYWFTPYMNKTLHSANYNGTDKATHYVDTSLTTTPPSLARVGKLLYWGGAILCMKFHNLLSGKTHNVPCTENSVRSFVVYERGKRTITFFCFLHMQ